MNMDSGCQAAPPAIMIATRDEPAQLGSRIQTRESQKEEFARRVADLVRVSTRALGVMPVKVPVKLDPTRTKTTLMSPIR